MAFVVRIYSEATMLALERMNMMKQKILWKLTTILPALVLFSACDIGTGQTSEPVVETMAYATVSINPSVAVMINEQNTIRTVHALNADGEMIMLQLQLEGKSLEEGIEEIVNESVALDFIDEETVDPVIETDVLSDQTMLKTQTETNLATHLENAFTAKNIQVQTRTRTYLQSEIDEAAALETTPLQLQLMKKAMIGNADLLDEEALELDVIGLLNKVKNGANNLNKIAATLGQDFLDERKLIQDEYREQILDLKEQIKTAIENGSSTDDLEASLSQLRTEMVDALQALIAEYRQQTTTAREQWRQEADNRRQNNSSTSSISA